MKTDPLNLDHAGAAWLRSPERAQHDSPGQSAATPWVGIQHNLLSPEGAIPLGSRLPSRKHHARARDLQQTIAGNVAGILAT
jgi:hypothetical protein